MLRQIAGGARLDREAHVHNLCGMSVAAGQINQASLSQNVDPAVSLQAVAHDIRAHFPGLQRVLSEPCHVHFHIEVSGVAEDGAVLHPFKIFAVDHPAAAGYRDEEIPDFRGLLHRHDVKAVHDGFDGPHGIHLGDNHPGAQSLRAHGGSLAAPAISGHDHDLPGHDQICRAVDAVPDGLSGSVAVVKQVLAVRVIYHDHGEHQLAGLLHGAKAQNPRRRLFAAADHFRQQAAVLRMHHMHQISAVVDDDLRMNLKNRGNMPLIFFVGGAVPSVYLHPVFRQSGCHVVLCRKGVAAGGVDLRSAGSQDFAQVGGLRLHMDRQGDPPAREGLFSAEILLQAAEQGHVPADPVDFAVAGGGEGNISDLRTHNQSPVFFL